MRSLLWVPVLAISAAIALSPSSEASGSVPPRPARAASAAAGRVARTDFALNQAWHRLASNAWADAESLAAARLRELERDPAADSLGMAEAMEVAARARWMAGLSIPRAYLDFASRSLGIRERLQAENPQARVRARVLLATLLFERGEGDSALTHARAALDLCHAGLAPSDTLAADAWRTIGRIRERRSDLQGAIEAYREAIGIRSRAREAGDAESALLYGWIGNAWYSRGDRDRARAALDTSLSLFERLGGRDHPNRWRALNAMANLENSEGNNARSLDLLQEALRVIRLTRRESARPGLIVRGNLAIGLLDIGDVAGSRATCTALLPDFEASFGRSNPSAVGIRQVLAASCVAFGDTAEALRHFVLAESLLTDPGQPPNPNLALGQRWQSQVLHRQGKDREARAACDRAIRSARAARDPIQRGEIMAGCYEVLTTILAALGDTTALDSARIELARIVDQSALGSTRAGAVARFYRARAAERLGRRGEAWTEALAADSQVRELLRRDIRALPDRRALELSQRGSLQNECVIALARGDASRLAVAWDRLVQVRGLVGAEVARRRLPSAVHTDSTLVALHRRWTGAQQRYAQALVRSGAANDSSTRAELAAMRDEAEESERLYARTLSSHGLGELAAVGLDSVLAHLKPRQALVAFVETAVETDPDLVSAFIARGGDARLRRVELSSASGIRSALDPWLERLSTSPGAGARPDGPAERECRRLGRVVRARTWDLLAPHIVGTTDVFVVLDGPLKELPWQALPDRGDRYLVERGPRIHVLNAERDLLAPPTPKPSGRLLAVGAPDFGYVSADEGSLLAAHQTGASAPPALVAIRSTLGPCGEAGTQALAPLPESGAEAEDVAKQWRSMGADAQLLLGSAAVEAEFKRDAPGCAVLHLATHGVVARDTCTFEAAGVRGLGGLSALADERPAQASGKSPRRPAPAPSESAARRPAPKSSLWSRRVWLALAGADRAKEHTSDANDGLLTAEEAVTLDLRGTDWVVLSACHAGLVARWSPDDALGMRRAFHLAGARTVIASQWAVEDVAAREWMDALYADRTSGAETAEAMAAASRRVLAARRQAGLSTHPFYWASFTATSD